MDFRNFPIIPTILEINNGNNDIDLSNYKRIKSKRYKSPDNYLERQFFLYREDCFRDLKLAIRKIRSQKWYNKNIILPDSNVWLYYNVLFSEYSFSFMDIIYKIKFKINDKIDWDEGKQLRYGSLLFLSDNYFQTYLVATVADSNPSDLKNGVVKIHLVDCPVINKSKITKPFQMIEMQVYFESYIHVLKQLQHLNDNLFPFKDYFLYNKTIPESILCRSLDCTLNLNASQLLAFKKALTENISLIQGPPGTGKTTVGFSIVESILKSHIGNRDTLKPILIVCYTNHALDQFLEKLLSICYKLGDLIRIGSKSENEKLKQYNINELKKEWKNKKKFPKHLAIERSKIFRQLDNLRNSLLEKRNCNENELLYTGEIYENMFKQFNEIGMREHQCMMESALVIGMTTTACARYASIFENMDLQVIIIEEAAEILEAHVICSITANCKHLIMIGDHKQLQPSNAVYEFGDLFNLNCSLFERLIDIGFENVTLKYQRRMRSEIAVCLSPIYPELKNDPNLPNYPDVNGFRTNIYFFQHQYPENITMKTSYENKFEVQFVIGICSFLLDRGVKEERITVLSTYKGQNNEINKRLHINRYNGIKSFVVDSYQGEENDIIILSLVRSNITGRIGFLKKENRICVALSRAKHGLFIVGNFDCLQRYPLWSKMFDILNDRRGKMIPITCKRNPDHHLTIASVDDFNNKYLCNKKCQTINSCGLHHCKRTCHDGDHGVCQEMVTKMCQRNLHKISIRCNLDVKCKIKVISTLVCGHDVSNQCCQLIPKICGEMISIKLLCNHEQIVVCGTKPVDVICEKRYDQLLQCGHTYTDCEIYDGLCDKDIEHRLPCCHLNTMKCFEKNIKTICIKDCQKMLSCGHICTNLCIDCQGGNNHQLCSKSINHQLSCDHMKWIKCFEKNLQHECHKLCGKELPCKHFCVNLCMNCENGNKHPPCNVTILQKLTCEHITDIPCSNINQIQNCTQLCNKMLQCGHSCLNMCHDCINGRLHMACQTKCSFKLICGHKCRDLCHPGKCHKCNNNCLITMFANLNIFLTPSLPHDTIQNWMVIMDSVKYNFPHSTMQMIKNIVNLLRSKAYQKRKLESIDISFKLMKQVLVFNDEVVMSINFDDLSDYREHIIHSIYRMVEWLDPLARNILHINITEFKMEFQRIKDLASLCQLCKDKNIDRKMYFFKILDDLIKVKYNAEMELKFKEILDSIYN